jgi:4-amino-4-deoxy-L-arabinose transferase-like glycosyltransferase
MPMHVRESHYVLTDVPMTFFVALTLLLSLRAHERGTMSAFVWAGVAAGWAAATKYNGLLAVLMPLCAAYAAPADSGSTRITRAFAVVGACFAAFLIAAPYTVLDLPAFLTQYAALAGHYGRSSRLPESPWLTYLKYLRQTMSWPGALLAAAGLVLAIVRAFTGPGHIRYVMLVLFPAIYFYVIATRTLVFGRYLLPVLPFACLVAAIAVVSGVSLLRRFAFPRNVRTALIAGGTIAAILPPFITSVSFDRILGRGTTQQQAYTWIRANVPPGSRIVVEGRVVQLPDARYRVQYVNSLAERDVQAYLNDGIDYLVASSAQFALPLRAPQAQPALYGRYRALFDEGEQAFTAVESPDLSGPEVRVVRLRRK